MHSQGLPETTRVQSIDILRGAVMVLMAIDHVRVYSGLPAGGPDPGIFFTRWVTHFCAPAFVFFAGTAAFLHGRKLNDTKKLAHFLLTRGFMLVVLELTLIRFGWTFNLHYSEFMLAGVIWMLGWCMVLMALLVRLRPGLVGVVGLAIIFLQQLFSLIPRILPESLKSPVGGLLEFIYSSGIEPLPGISILYVLVPWIGVMAAGYGFGTILLLEPKRRRKLCLQIGLSATFLFLVVGSILILSTPAPAGAPPFIFRLLSQQKYPASQLFLMMTLGPAIAFIPLAEKTRSWIGEALALFGRVPFFYYLLHIPLIHISALAVNFFRAGSIHQEWYSYAPFTSIPEEFRWSLPLLYLVFVIDVLLLYAACSWYVKYKFSHPDNKWVKYI
jgi:uncharacterized membrane protein